MKSSKILVAIICLLSFLAVGTVTAEPAMAQSKKDRTLVMDDGVLLRILARLPANKRASSKGIIERSLAATRKGNTKDIVKTIATARKLGFWDSLESCGKHCEHLLDEGNAPGYGVCYWACVARGGPGAAAAPGTKLAPQ